MRNAVSRFCLLSPRLKKTASCLCLRDLRYYINLCQGIHGGLTDCPEEAAVCRHSSGRTQILGFVYTQKMSYAGGQNQMRHFILNICLNLSQPKKWPKNKNMFTQLAAGLMECHYKPVFLYRWKGLNQLLSRRWRLWKRPEGQDGDPAELWFYIWSPVIHQVTCSRNDPSFWYASQTFQLMTDGYVCF